MHKHCKVRKWGDLFVVYQKNHGQHPSEKNRLTTKTAQWIHLIIISHAAWAFNFKIPKAQNDASLFLFGFDEL